MQIGNWEGLAPVTAAAALVLLAFLPDDPAITTTEMTAVGNVGSYALELGETGSRMSWDASGVSGMVMPLGVFRSADGDWCRHYVVSVDDDDTVLSRTACRQGDGQWRNVDAPQTAEAAR